MDSLSSDLVPSLNEIVVDIDNLFANKLFYLIYVDDNDKMSLVKPFDEKVRKDVQGISLYFAYLGIWSRKAVKFMTRSRNQR